MTAADPGGTAPDETREAVRRLEGAFSELMTEFRRVYVQAAESVSPGMLPGTYKVLSTISRCGSVNVSSLAERMAADKGQVSRSVTELEELGLVERTTDAADGRIKQIAVTPEGEVRLAAARLPYEGRLHEVIKDWPVETIDRLTELLHALATGGTPAAD